MQNLIEQAWEEREHLSSSNPNKVLRDALLQVLADLSSGRLRVSEKLSEDQGGIWYVHQWIKKAILLSFRLFESQLMDGGFSSFYDKIPLHYAHYTQTDFAQSKVRVVPPTNVRHGAYIGPNVVLMPCFVNMGAYVGEGTLIDTWATVGSCAHIGARVHLSGGAGIGGVLEPLQANPTIIEDDCFIGARSEIVEGVIVEAGSVIGMGVFIGQSTKIYDREHDRILQGRVPAGSVVVPGSLPSNDGKYALNCAVIVKRVDLQTRTKIGLNNLLRDLPS